jgi:carbon-monoxide dehydrogenase large subunit
MIGQPLPRLEDRRLVTGNGRYTDDIDVPGQAYAAFLRSPHAHARIVSIDIGAALAAPGVIAVLTGADYLADGFQGMQHVPMPLDAIDPTAPAFRDALHAPAYSRLHLPLPVDNVRHVGEAVAMVVADTAARAARSTSSNWRGYGRRAAAAARSSGRATAARRSWRITRAATPSCAPPWPSTPRAASSPPTTSGWATWVRTPCRTCRCRTAPAS